MAVTVKVSASLRCRCVILLLSVIVSVAFPEQPTIYLVLMEGEPILFHHGAGLLKGERSDPNSEAYRAHAKHLEDSHDQLLQNTIEVGSYKKLYSFKHIINGFAVHTTPSQAKKLELAEGVKLVEEDRGVKLMTTYTPEFLELPMGVWSQEGGDTHAGEDLVIGVIDTGIDPMHPSFAYDPLKPYTSNPHRFSGDCQTGPRFPASSCNGKIISARYFSAGAQSITLNTSKDFLSPFDAAGHGSHVASIAAGNYGVSVVVNSFLYGYASGMAPRARIAVYKAVFPSIGTMADVVAAIDQAVLDQVDIISLSIGPNSPPEDKPIFLNVFDISMLFAQRAGVFVVQAAGNQGPTPSSIESYSPWVVGVAACNIDRSFPGKIVLGDGQNINGVGLSGPTFGNWLLQYKLVLAKDAVKESGTFPMTPQYVEECQYPEALDPTLVLGSIVICTFSAGFSNGTSTLSAIIDTATELGFMGFVLTANPLYGDYIAEPVPFVVPGIMIPKVADAQILLQYYEQWTSRDPTGRVTKYNGRAAIGEGRVASFQGRAPSVSRFSSRGPDIIDSSRRNLADVLKPDILAPGHLIWAAWSPTSISEPLLNGYNFALLSGTSMATPHVAGVAALIKQHNPSWTPSMIASAISTTASRYDNYGEPIMAEGFNISSLYPSTPFDFGAGLINPKRALDPGLVFTSGFEDYVEFLCSLPNTNLSLVEAVTGRLCNHSLAHPSDLNLPSITISRLVTSQVVRRSVKNIESKPETYVSAVLHPNGVEVSVNPSQFTIDSQGTQDMEITISVTQALNSFSFGEIVLTGTLDHIVRIPLSVLTVPM
ncbi:subtilisin-like protease SBT2.4 isoform X2 [Macadamia integrifolia]|uniref:subtilisin-like protease SBT2.4 isoform X2 n=1 Tax=Macadamia integrifolia TaxID=60698 RepID=UPI001C52B3FA|nr:subtilisin-like protease SBT2.4 isoform X2 [Macadamia integrifolia]